MLIARIEDLVQQHNDNTIEINQINSKHGPLIDNISHKGTLKMNGHGQIDYINENGKVSSIVNLHSVTDIDYTIMNYKNPNDNSDNDNKDDSNDNNNSDDDGSKFGFVDKYGGLIDTDVDTIMNAQVLEKARFECGILYPAKLIDGTLLYPMDYVYMINNEVFSETGSIHADKYDNYTENGYLHLIKGGYSQITLALPEAGKYRLKAIIGSEDNLGKQGSALINGLHCHLVANMNKKYKWQLVSIKDSITNSNIENDEFLFNADRTMVRYELNNNDSEYINIDSLVLVPKIMDMSVDTDIKLGVKPDLIHDDLLNVPVSKSYLYSNDKIKVQGYKIYTSETKNNKYLTDQLVSINNSELVYEVIIPESGFYNIGLLVQNTKYTKNGKFKLSINNSNDELMYGRYYYDKDNYTDKKVYDVRFRPEYKGNINISTGNDKVHLDEGLNVFRFSLDNEDHIHKESPLINGLLLSQSDQYNAISNDKGKRLLPNIDDIYFLNDLESLNTALNSKELDARNAINIRENYDDVAGLPFKFGIRDFDLTDIDETEMINYKVSMDYLDHNSYDQGFTHNGRGYLMPKVAIIASPNLDHYEYEDSIISRYIDLEFVIYNHAELESFDIKPDEHTLVHVRDRSLSYIPGFHKLTDFDLGDNWKELYLNMNGISMAEKVFIYNSIKDL